MIKIQSIIVRMVLIWMLILVSFILLGAKAFGEIKRVNIGKIPEWYWIEDFMGCEI